MNNKEKIMSIPIEKYKGIFGAEKNVFDRLLGVAATCKRKSKLSILDRLVITLKLFAGIPYLSTSCI